MFAGNLCLFYQCFASGILIQCGTDTTVGGCHISQHIDINVRFVLCKLIADIDNQQEKVKNIYEQSSKQRFFIIDNFPFSLYK